MKLRNCPPQLRLHLKRTAEIAVQHGHPWVFADSIRRQNRPGTLGELAVLFDTHDEFLGIGLFDPESPLRVRLLHVGDPMPLDRSWWVAHLKESLQKRARLFGPETTGYRCLHGESDGWPGLVLDRYDRVFVLKIYTAAWLPRLPELIGWIEETVHPERLVLRLSRNIQKTANALECTRMDRTATAAKFECRDGQLLRGEPLPDERALFRENGLLFEAEVVHGQKTGFFLDQRENRQRVREMAANRDVLNAFSYTGGFSVYAAAGGARSVTDLDISSHALEGSERHFRINQDLKKISQCRRRGVQSDAFDWLAQKSGERFDLIILDPPSLAKREQERSRAIAAHQRLASSAIKHLRAGGILVACSCSAHVSASEFFEAIRSACRNSGRQFRELLTSGHPPDHPAGFPEAFYLKCIYLIFDF